MHETVCSSSFQSSQSSIASAFLANHNTGLVWRGQAFGGGRSVAQNLGKKFVQYWPHNRGGQKYVGFKDFIVNE